jgi:hypothetical protein
MAKREKTAPIQKASTTAESPPANPRKKPMTKIYFTSPNPIHRPLEIIKMSKKGSIIAKAENKWKLRAKS